MVSNKDPHRITALLAALVALAALALGLAACGGGSSINVMAWVRGHQHDFDLVRGNDAALHLHHEAIVHVAGVELAVLIE